MGEKITIKNLNQSNDFETIREYLFGKKKDNFYLNADFYISDDWWKQGFWDWIVGIYVNNELAGFIKTNMRGETSSFYISNLLIFKQYRRKGLAKRLFEYTLSAAISQFNLRRVELYTIRDCSEKETKAELFWKSMGFSLQGVQNNRVYNKGKFYPECFYVRTKIK